MNRPCYLEIKLGALRHNFQMLTMLAPESNPIAVIKADAYGNGAIKVAEALDDISTMFAVAFYEEALELRQAGINKAILVLQGPHHEHQLEQTQALNLHWMLHSEQQLEWFSLFNKQQRLDGYQWLKFDTGMHRLGFLPAHWKRLKLKFSDVFTDNAVIATHLACADEADPTHCNQQLAEFLSLMRDSSNPSSIANSAGTIMHHEARASYNRIGIAAYGSSPFNYQHDLGLQTVSSFRTSIIALREIPKGDTVGYGATWQAQRKTLIATVTAGYADGYPRHAPSGTLAMLKGKPIKLVGRVSMDMLMFDVSDLEEVQIGDEVELWGEQININDLAKQVGTIGYELMTRVSKRVPRIYKPA